MKKYLLASLITITASSAFSAAEPHDIEWSRGEVFAGHPVYDIQINWTDWDQHRRAGIVPHFNWDLVGKVMTRGAASCHMCGKGLRGRDNDNFNKQIYLSHPLYAGLIAVGKCCKHYMTKTINGDYEIRDTVTLIQRERANPGIRLLRPR